ncbi:MAG: hypothetical protein SynsKO_39000 [Synoicihabitans sp.]
MKKKATDSSSGLVAFHLVFSMMMIVGVVAGFVYIDRQGYYGLSTIPLYLLLGYLLFQSLAVLYHSLRSLIQR